MRTLLLFLLACKSPTPTAPVETDTDTDTDSDTDTDTDSDTDADSDTDTDADADTAIEYPLDGYGTLTGDCDALDSVEWGSTSPFLFRNAVDFGTTLYDPALLSPGGNTIHTTGNLGGSSVESEAIAFDVMYRCEAASLLKTEGEILYTDSGGKKTDYLAEIDGFKIGVSVTRAFHFPPTDPYTLVEAQSLLDDKLGDVLLSNTNADPADAWDRAILQVIAYDSVAADQIELAWADVDPLVRESTIVVVTVTDGEESEIY